MPWTSEVYKTCLRLGLLKCELGEFLKPVTGKPTVMDGVYVTINGLIMTINGPKWWIWDDNSLGVPLCMLYVKPISICDHLITGPNLLIPTLYKHPDNPANIQVQVFLDKSLFRTARLIRDKEWDKQCVLSKIIRDQVSSKGFSQRMVHGHLLPTHHALANRCCKALKDACITSWCCCNSSMWLSTCCGDSRVGSR